ncbi:hypothetical protein IJ098_01735 [Candidatus Saccharibacteria bacterium]|nr:hypothetical protein [Candidatus Saccharibacteria bacterium]
MKQQERMSKKNNLDDTAKKVEDISGKVNIIMRNRLIIAIFLMIDGITFITNPDNTMGEMAKSIIMILLFATLTVLITNLVSKTKDIKTIVVSLAVLAAGTFFYFYPDLISAYIQLLLSLFIIYDGVTNIAKALNLTWLSKFTRAVAKKFNSIGNGKKKGKKATDEKFKEVDKNLNEGLEQQKAKLINPLRSIVGKTKKSSALFIVINAVSIAFGVILLIFPGVSMTIWGIIFLYMGLSSLMVAAKTMNLAKKIKERKFKEILLGEDQKATKSDKKLKTKSKKSNSKSRR